MKRGLANKIMIKKIKPATPKIYENNLNELEKFDNVEQYNKKYDHQSDITTSIGKLTKSITYHACKKLEQLIEKDEISSDVINQRIVVKLINNDIILERIDQATLNDQLKIEPQDNEQAINYSLEYGTVTPLHLAVKEESIEIVELLIKNGADINTKAQRWFILNLYNKQNNEFDFSIFTYNQDTFTALDIAYKNDNQKIIDLLLAEGAKRTIDSEEDQSIFDADTEEDMDNTPEEIKLTKEDNYQIPKNSDDQLEQQIPPVGESSNAIDDY